MTRALLINPWIHDFAAYDFWVRPLGLLRLGRLLREAGVEVYLIDCLNPDPSLARAQGIKRHPHGRGKFPRHPIPRPPGLAAVPRQYSRYGMPVEAFVELLRGMQPPDAVLVSSGMTYWYPGVQEAIALCKRIHPAAPVVLGGIYATLCQGHARTHSGADIVVPGSYLPDIWGVLCSALGLSTTCPDRFPLPCWDLLPWANGVVVKTSEGCPFSCSYCASGLISKGYVQRDADEVVEEISTALDITRTQDVAFYDDALLEDFEGHLAVILERLRYRGDLPRFHCPNGLHVRDISAEVASGLKRGNFVTLRLGLESLSPTFHQDRDRKLTTEQFQGAVDNLLSAGFRAEQIGVYLLVGLPEQTVLQVEQDVDALLAMGVRPYLAEYSPVPGTALWEKALEVSPFPLEEDPVYHNNTLLPCQWEGFTMEDLRRLKSKISKALRARTQHPYK